MSTLWKRARIEYHESRKDYTIEEVTTEKAVTAKTVNSCWGKLCLDVPNFTIFTVEEVVKEIIDMAKSGEGNVGGFQDLDLGEWTSDSLADVV